ncbi:BT1 family-domain-containing protein [Paraphysoderma sedebokerense]|nr:BT1 family-domain-containing protein [Paraphysoderma sedebokerense]
MSVIDKILSGLTYPLRAPLEILQFFRKARSEYGSMVLILVMTCYLYQGMRDYVDLSFSWFGIYHYKQSSDEAETGQKAALLPWSLKVIFGLWFDNVPIFRRHSKPYLLLAALLGIVGFVACSFDGGVPTWGSFIGFGMLIQLGGACSDVLVDGIVVKAGRDGGQGNSADLQSLSWSTLGVGLMIGQFLGGQLSEQYIAPIDAKKEELSEKKITKQEYTDYINNTYFPTEPLRWYFRLMLLFPVMIFIVTAFYKERRSNVRFGIRPIIFNLWKVIQTLLLTPQVLKPMFWVYLHNATKISMTTLWPPFLQSELNISPAVQSYVDATSYAFFIIGTMLYARFFTGMSYRKLFFYSQSGMILMRLANMVLIKELNLAIGIPNVAFYFITSCANNIIERLNSMPLLILAAQVCPLDMENTFFALLMSLSNLTSGQLPLIWSKPIIKSYGLNGKVWTGFEAVNWIHFGLGFIPLLFIWLLPTFSAILSDEQRIELGLPVKEKKIDEEEFEKKMEESEKK